MGKLLFWIVIIIGVLFVARIAGRMAAARAPEAMVRCAHCGIHLPRSEALLQGGQTWCSQEHARLGPATK